MCCPLVFEFSVGIGGFVIGLGQISFFFSLKVKSRKYQGVFEVKSRVKTWQVRGNLVSTIGALASPKMGDGTRCPEG